VPELFPGFGSTVVDAAVAVLIDCDTSPEPEAGSSTFAVMVSVLVFGGEEGSASVPTVHIPVVSS
jgi:hypothetical protein